MYQVKIFFQFNFEENLSRKRQFSDTLFRISFPIIYFFTQVKSLFHHQRYYTNNSSDTKSFFMVTSFYCLAGSSFTQSTKFTL